MKEYVKSQKWNWMFIGGFLLAVLIANVANPVFSKPSKDECYNIYQSLNTSSIGPYTDEEIDQINENRETFGKYCTDYNYSDIDPLLQMGLDNQ